MKWFTSSVEMLSRCKQISMKIDVGHITKFTKKDAEFGDIRNLLALCDSVLFIHMDTLGYPFSKLLFLCH